MKPGFAYCKRCAMKLEVLSTSIDNEKRTVLVFSLEYHKTEVAEESKVYKKLHQEEHEKILPGNLHRVFAFAGKVPLPYLLREMGHPYFTKAKKFDFFGVSVSNLNRGDIFCLPEGHWFTDKTANEVARILRFST